MDNNRDLMLVNVNVDCEFIDDLRKSFQKEYTNYFVVAVPSLNTHEIKIEVIRL